MTEKERGVIEAAEFPSLWDTLCDPKGGVR